MIVILFLAFTTGLSFFIQPSEAASVTILSYTEVVDLAGDYWVFGEVQNLDASPIYFVEINASFYDSSNNLITNGHGYCHLTNILPNRKSPFYVSVNVDNETQVSRIDHYTFETSSISEYPPPAPPLGLEILWSNASINLGGWIEAIGEVMNVGTTNASFIDVYGTCYDSDGKVLDVDIGHLNYSSPYSLPPGQKVSFDVMFNSDVVPLAKSYVLTAESLEYTCYEYQESPTPAPPSVTILSYSEGREWVSSEGEHGFSLYGEVQNLGTVPVHCQINASFYDSSNTLIAQGQGYCGPSILPNRKAPFVVTVYDDNETQVSRIDHSVLEVVNVGCYSSTEFPLGLKILWSNATIGSSGWMDITGEIENTQTMDLSYVSVYGTCYDSDGNVVAFNADSFDSMLPGQKLSFTIGFWPDAVSQAKSYVLTADSLNCSYFEYQELAIPTSSAAEPGTTVPSESSATPLYTTAWVPPPENAAFATAVTAVTVGVVSVVVAAVSNPAGLPTGRVVEKTRDLLPESVKKWLEEFVSSKREFSVDDKRGSVFLPTKYEVLAYAVSLLFLTFSFSYVKVNDLSQIFSVLPNILVSAIIIEFVKTFALEVFAKSRGVWTEHKIWFLGLAMFLVTTFAFGIPFSSPSRNVYHAPKLTKRVNGIISAVAVLVVLAFAGLFFVLMIGGFVLIGSTGLAMCSITAFIDSFPVAPMNGKAIYDYNKVMWAVLFAVTIILYGSWLIFL
jgi:hypothetical protein